MNNFIDFLDNYSKRLQNEKLDYSLMTSIINHNYVEDKLYNSSILGNNNSKNQLLYYYPESFYSYYSKPFYDNIDISNGTATATGGTATSLPTPPTARTRRTTRASRASAPRAATPPGSTATARVRQTTATPSAARG
jgi:hypothetical protein